MPRGNALSGLREQRYTRSSLQRASVAVLALAVLACRPPSGGGAAPILLFAGTGTSPNDVSAFERLLITRRFAYASADSRQLDALTAAQLSSHRLLIAPGGNFEVMGNSLAPGTSATIRAAVHGGLNYLGVCAGAFLATRGESHDFGWQPGQ